MKPRNRGPEATDLPISDVDNSAIMTGEGFADEATDNSASKASSRSDEKFKSDDAVDALFVKDLSSRKGASQPPIAEMKPVEASITPPPKPSAPVIAPTAQSTQATLAKPPPPYQALSQINPPQKGVLKMAQGNAITYWGTTTLISLLWVAGLVAFGIGAESGLAIFKLSIFKSAIIALLAIFPAGLVFACAFALRQAAALARETARSMAMADAMVAPSLAATQSATGLIEALKQQVDHAVASVKQAQNDIETLSLKLKLESEAIVQTTLHAQTASQTLSQTMGQERDAMAKIGASLDTQSQDILANVGKQARMVAEASDLAQAQLREAEAALAARAADLATAAADVHDTARVVTDDLGRQTLRLETAGAGVADQIKSVEDGLSQQRAGLVSAALSLRADQEDFAVHLESQRLQLGDALSVTRLATVDLGEISSRGVDVLRDIVISAQTHFAQVMGAADNERTSFETRIHSTLANISLMAADARDELVQETNRALKQLETAATEARNAADQAAISAHKRVDRLNESLFEAGKMADESFENRLGTARRLIEDSASLITEAGDKTIERLDQSFAQTRMTLAQVDEAFSELNANAERMPAFAIERINSIRQSVEDGINAMTEAAKKASVETESIDQAFQDRVKRNYDMLTEAVQLMGIISGNHPLATANISASLPTPTPAPHVPMPQPRPPIETAHTPLNAPPVQNLTQNTAPPLRSARASAPQRVQTPQGWSWSDLLNGMEGRTNEAFDTRAIEPSPPPTISEPDPDTLHDYDDAPTTKPKITEDSADSFNSLDDMLIAEIASMGIDANALLSHSRMDETVSAILSQDNEGARLVVRRIAPAAVRRLTRRLVSDTDIRDSASEFVAFYDRQLNIALLAKDARTALNNVLANDTGRAYLLLDAAISDII